MKQLLLVASLSWVLGLTGCSAEMAASDTDEAPAADIGEPIQTLDVGTERLKFFAAADAGSILISSTKPNNVPRFTVDILEETAGKQLTPLEVFQAVAPAGIEPDARLVEDHLRQTAALGRSDSAPIEVAFEPQEVPSVEKAFTPAQCKTLLFGSTIVVWGRDNLFSMDACTANRPGIVQGTCSAWIQTNRHRAGVCNNSATVTMSGTATLTSEGGGSGSTPANVPPNTSQLWTGVPALNGNLTGFVRSKMRLRAQISSGATFHTRLADF